MKKLKYLLLFLFSATLFSETIYVSIGIPMYGYKMGSANINISVKEIDTDIVCSSITWGTKILGSGWQLAERYIELDVSCCYSFWRVEIYTNNTNAATPYQKAGLISTSVNTIRIPLAWLVSATTVPITNIGEPGPLETNLIKGATTQLNVSWTYMKDKNDTDDPNTQPWDESWNSASSSGYTTVCYGGSDYTMLCYGISANSPLKIYLEALTNYVTGNMFYSTTIWFDLTYVE